MDNLYKSKQRLVSVVIPTYNYDKYICEALDGLKKQTYKNIEVIIIDDYSTDDTEKIVSEWRKNNLDVFKDFIYLKVPRNCDEEWALNIGLNMTKGEYIVIHGADDISHEKKIQKQVSFLIDNSEVDVIGIGYKAFKGNINNVFYIADWICYHDRAIIRENYKPCYIRHCVSAVTIMFRRHILEKVIGYRKLAYGVNDVFFINDIINNDYIVVNINENLYYYRSHEQQKSTKMHDETYIDEKMKRISGRVSMVLLVNNGSNAIINSIKSIFSQTYSNIELIIVDNVLDDNTEKLIKKWYSDYKNKNDNKVIKEFIYFKLPRKVGYPSLYNIGSYLSKGEYIAFHSDNGRSNKYKIEKQVEFLKNNIKYSIVGTNYDDNDGDIKYDEGIVYGYTIDYTKCVNINTIMLRAEVINETAGLNRRMLGNEDFEFIYRLLNEGYRIQNLKEILYYESI